MSIIDQRDEQDKLTQLAEDAVRLIIQANGGLPMPTSKEGVFRPLVRELRELYSELQTPTPVPGKQGKGSSPSSRSAARAIEYDIEDDGF